MFALKSVEGLSKSLKVCWEDGKAAQFSYLWLKDTALRPALVHIDLNTKPEDLQFKKDILTVTWPRYAESSFTSKFLRRHITDDSNNNLLIDRNILNTPDHTPSESSYCPKVLKEHGCLITSLRLAPKITPMGIITWTGAIREPATVWPYLQQVPSLVSVEPLKNKPCTLYLVDMYTALKVFHNEEPHLYSYLIDHPWVYRSGPFVAHHKLLNIQNGKIISAIFNNDQRCSEIPMNEEFYLALKKFGIISTRLMKVVKINPGQILFINNQTTLLGAPAEYNRIMKVCTYF
uniref:MOSC domain-containing protein n=1 Tax=Strongyloides venezuelensis TaxID=75913 RepID=A0A0K0G1U4_STRVS